MAWSGVKHFSRDELIGALKKLVAERGRDVTFREFQRAIGRSAVALEPHFSNWGELRLAAGLLSRRPKAMKLISDEELIAEYRRVCQLLRRTPDDREFGNLASCAFMTLRKRFGDGPAIRQRASGWYGTKPYERIEPTDRESAPWVVKWLSSEWLRARAALVWRSGSLQGNERSEFDVVFCVKHDWPECPWPVIEWSRAVRNRPQVAVEPAEGKTDAAEGIPEGDARGTGP